MIAGCEPLPLLGLLASPVKTSARYQVKSGAAPGRASKTPEAPSDDGRGEASKLSQAGTVALLAEPPSASGDSVARLYSFESRPAS